MSGRITLAVARRVLLQLRHDPRTVGLLLLVPCLLLILVRYVLDDTASFGRVGVPMLGLFPFILMFLATSITMLRERTTGTLERLMSMPLRNSTCSPATGSRLGSLRRFRPYSCR